MNGYNTTFAKSEADVVALHPGPSADFRFPDRPVRTMAETLAAEERRLINMAVERFVDGKSEISALARRIIVLRAELSQEKARAHV